MTSYIYFIQAQGDGPIKVGTTGDNPRKRMVKIQSDCPWPVTLLGAIEGTVSQEKQIHLVLSRFRTQGEWFEPHPIVLAAIQTALEHGVQASFAETPARETDLSDAHPLRRWRDERGLTQEGAGDLIGVSFVYISRWERGMFLPHRKYWEKIEDATGLSIAQFMDCLQPLRVSQ